MKGTRPEAHLQDYLQTGGESTEQYSADTFQELGTLQIRERGSFATIIDLGIQEARNSKRKLEPTNDR